MANKALVIDDDKVTLELLTFQLESEGFEVVTAESGNVGLDLIKQNDFDVILTDLHLPDVSGIGLVKSSKELAPQTEIIMITGDGSNDRAIEATKAGAFWYLEKPLDFDELFELIGKAVERKRQAAEIIELRGRLSSKTSYEGIIGGARSMQNIYEIIDNVADSEANILILGESGTGKEVIANAIHYKSIRASKPFVKVNCSALPKDLIESQLFGHIKGSFTGANVDKVGFIGQAHGGSLLLDEIGEMPADLQPKLLRVLQEKVYYRVGSDKPQEADFRLICSTNRNPFDAIKDGNLREDLYYRVNTIEIEIPPLRDRMEDVPMLAEHFLQIYADKYKKQSTQFSQNAYNQMLNYHWRGNVRELEHVIERAVLLSRGGRIESFDLLQANGAAVSSEFPTIQFTAAAAAAGAEVAPSFGGVSGLPAMLDLEGEALFEEIGKFIVDRLRDPSDGADQKDVFNDIESGVVLAALKRTRGNKQAAANLLGLYRPRLYGMIKRHHLEDKV
ncbi:MAG: sigma-54-dependent Fis family transcriptional regulator [Blastocatellia bacterium]|nr:sigma-54-dependent Fis family transcriptional regulator [Blastocatellia bacterium]